MHVNLKCCILSIQKYIFPLKLVEGGSVMEYLLYLHHDHSCFSLPHISMHIKEK